MVVGRHRLDDVHDRDGDRIRGLVDREYGLEVATWMTPVNIARTQIQTLLMIASMGVTPLVKVQKIFGMV